jgi:RimJ/RimL family protein N-acetyltransferase
MIRGEKVILREKRLSDASNDYAWRCDPELARLDGAVALKMPFSEFMPNYADELYYPSPIRRRFAIDNLKGEHIGNCMYYDIDERRKQAELGILIGDRKYWDKGYGTDAVITMVNYIFESTPLQRIHLSTLDWNIRAQKSFSKCGFTPRGYLNRDGNRFLIMEIWNHLEQAEEATPSSQPGKAKRAE